jgi:tetratricopeptide (TPR) repeat protein
MSGDWDVRFDRGLALARRRFHHAALEVWSSLLDEPCPSEAYALLCDEIGKLYVRLGADEAAMRWFQEAAANATTAQAEARYKMHAAMVYRLSEPDRAYRMITEVLHSYGDRLPPEQLALLYNNYADIQWVNEFFEEGLRSMRLCLSYVLEAGLTHYLPTVHLNLGVFYMETGAYDQARAYLTQAAAHDAPAFHTMYELSRLCLLTGDLTDCVEYARRAMPHVVWSATSAEKHDVARLCRLLAYLASHTGEPALRLRLLEKAQLLFGQLGMWQAWRALQQTMDEWETAPPPVTLELDLSALDIDGFVTTLDIMQAQEVLGRTFSALLDTRVVYADALAQALQASSQDRQDLALACRVVDFGLTALEPDVIENPSRSPSASRQYQQHPTLSANLLTALGVPARVAAIAADHHEAYDGSGFPAGRHGTDIDPLARVFAVIDLYTTAVVLEGQSHSAALQKVAAHAGTLLDPDMTRTFLRLFEI